jgi:hypothetical protein
MRFYLKYSYTKNAHSTMTSFAWLAQTHKIAYKRIKL